MISDLNNDSDGISHIITYVVTFSNLSNKLTLALHIITMFSAQAIDASCLYVAKQKHLRQKMQGQSEAAVI